MVMKLEGVSLKRQGKPVLTDIDGEFEAGKIYALLGPNGAGKSTLLHLMAQLMLLDAESGAISLHGQKLEDYSAEQLAQHLAYLPQHSQLQFPLSVEEVLSLATLPFDLTKLEQRQRIQSIVQQWGIEDFLQKDFRQLSGGEQQRCQLARTYLQLDCAEKNGLWLLDEPSSSLDLEHQQQLHNMCQQAAKKGHCVVIVLHDINRAMMLADEVWLLKKGVLVAQGEPTEALTEACLQQVFNVKATLITPEGQPPQFLFSGG